MRSIFQLKMDQDPISNTKLTQRVYFVLYLFVYFKFIYLSYNLSDDNNLSIILTRKILIIFLSICQCPLISIYHDKQKKINLSIILSMALNICHLPIYLSNGQSVFFHPNLLFFYLSITNSYVHKKNIQRWYTS